MIAGIVLLEALIAKLQALIDPSAFG